MIIFIIQFLIGFVHHIVWYMTIYCSHMPCLWPEMCHFQIELCSVLFWYSTIIFLHGSKWTQAYDFGNINSFDHLLSHLMHHNYSPSKLKVNTKKKVREKSRECQNHKLQPFPDPKMKRKPTNPNKHKLNKRTKSIKISSLFPKRGNRNTKRTEKHKNKMTHGKTYNKSPRRINHKVTKSKTNTGTTALERSVE